jgi:hypothetical protein
VKSLRIFRGKYCKKVYNKVYREAIAVLAPQVAELRKYSLMRKHSAVVCGYLRGSAVNKKSQLPI